MTYLLAKYTLLFVLTAIVSFVFGYWFSRRNFVDVSESFEDLRKANDRSDATQWDRLFKHLHGLPEAKATDLTDVYRRLDKVSSAVSSLPVPEPISFASVDSRLDALSDNIRAIPVPDKPRDVDLQPVVDRLNRLENSIKAIPSPKVPERVDFAPLTSKLDKIELVVRNIPKPVAAKEVNLAPVSSKLGALEKTVHAMSRPQSVNLAPFDKRLQAIERELGELGKRIAKPQSVQKAPRKSVSTATHKEPRILSSALFGKKDDLKLISGVGPKLEMLLNHNGVYYFWQVAEWNRQDIHVIDERLDAFKGRIARDDWVHQAKRLKRQASAAQMPAN